MVGIEKRFAMGRTTRLGPGEMWARSYADVGRSWADVDKVPGRCGQGPGQMWEAPKQMWARPQASVNKPGDRAARTEHHSRAGLVVSLFVCDFGCLRDLVQLAVGDVKTLVALTALALVVPANRCGRGEPPGSAQMGQG